MPSDPATTTRLGRDGPAVSAFCLGSMTWGTQTPPEDAHRQIDMARDHGVTFIDTAEMYPVNPITAATRGRTEQIIGDWIATHGRPDDMVIATKVTGIDSDVIEGGTPPLTPARLRAAVEDSLARLRCGCIDVFQLHWPDRDTYHFRENWTYHPPQEDADALRDAMLALLAEAQDLIREGKIAHFALSNDTAWGMAQWLGLARAHGLPRPVSLQNEYSLLCRLFDTDLAELCALEGVTLLAFSPLAAGLLTGKYAGGVTPEGSRRSLRPDLGGRITPRVFEAVSAYLGLAREWGLDPVQMALAWVAARPVPTVPILGATTAEQLATQLPALTLSLPQGLAEAIDEMHRLHPMPY